MSRSLTASKKRQQSLLTFWQAALSAVNGEQAVKQAIDCDTHFSPDSIIAVGKAASSMCLCALACFEHVDDVLVITKYGHDDTELLGHNKVTVLQSAHPVPDQQSLQAGHELLTRVQQMPPGSRLLLLVSGGTSALAEVLPEGIKLKQLRSLTNTLLASGQNIAKMNQQRKKHSLIKDGKLLQQFNGAEIRVYAISDVEGDDISTIGSGLGDTCLAKVKTNAKIIACNEMARNSAARLAVSLGYRVLLNEESLYDDVFVIAEKMGKLLRSAKPGVYLWGGEPTIILPKKPGQGGRNQSLALAISQYLQGRDNITLLVAGTDGSDGPTTAAGAMVDGTTFTEQQAAKQALEKADAGSYLRKQDQLFITGPTNTNVMDLIIAIVD